MPKSTDKKNAKKTLTLDDVLAHIVEARPSLGHKIIHFILDNLEENVHEICSRVNKDNGDGTVQAMCALEGMTMEAMAPGNHELRFNLARALSKELGNEELDNYALIVILQQLSVLREIMTVGAVLQVIGINEDVTAMALNTLRSIFIESPPDEEFLSNVLVAVISALRGPLRLAFVLIMLEQGYLDDMRPFFERILKKSPEKLTEMELAVVAILADIGCKDVKEMLEKMLSDDSSVMLQARARRGFSQLILYYADRAKTRGGFGNFARRLQAEREEAAEEEHGENSEEAFENEDDFDFQACLIAKDYFMAERKASGLSALIDAYGYTQESLEITLTAVGNQDIVVHEAAMELLKFGFAGVEFTEALLTEAVNAKTPRVKAALVEVLAHRVDKIVRPFIMSCLFDESEEVREAAKAAVVMMYGAFVDPDRIIDTFKGKGGKQ